jgi:hypothetical protein
MLAARWTFLAAGLVALPAAWKLGALRGQVVSVEGRGTERRIEARALGLDDDGALRVEPLAGGASFRVESGDVWLAGP